MLLYSIYFHKHCVKIVKNYFPCNIWVKYRKVFNKYEKEGWDWSFHPLLPKHIFHLKYSVITHNFFHSNECLESWCSKHGLQHLFLLRSTRDQLHWNLHFQQDLSITVRPIITWDVFPGHEFSSIYKHILQYTNWVFLICPYL